MQKFVSKLKGIGLLELMLSLAIIAILLVMATRYFSSASKAQKGEDTVQLIGEFESAISSYTSSTGGPKKDATLTALLEQGYLSQGRVGADKQLKQIWGSPITYTEGVSLSFAGVALTECKAMAARFGSTGVPGDTSPATCKGTDSDYGVFTYTFK